MDKSKIIKEIKLYLGFKNDTELADFLGIKQNTLSTWKSRNTMDYDLVISKCDFIDANWLLTGQGPMLKSELQPAVSSPQPQENDNNEIVSLLKDKIALLEKNNALQERENAYLSEKIKNLQEELKQHKKTAQSTMPDVLHQSTR